MNATQTTTLFEHSATQPADPVQVRRLTEVPAPYEDPEELLPVEPIPARALFVGVGLGLFLWVIILKALWLIFH
jgi:hypothetical protein